MWIFMPAKPQSERTTLIWSRLNPGPCSSLAYQSVRPRREKLSIQECELKQRLLVVMVAAAELRAKYCAPLTECDSGGIPASIREKSPNQHLRRPDEKLNWRHAAFLSVWKSTTVWLSPWQTHTHTLARVRFKKETKPNQSSALFNPLVFPRTRADKINFSVINSIEWKT